MARDRLRALVSFVCSSCRSSLPQRPSILSQITRNFITSSNPAAPRTSGLDASLSRPTNDGSYNRGSSILGALDFSPESMPEAVAHPQTAARLYYVPPHRIHVYCTKHNTHMTLTRPPPRKQKLDVEDAYKPPEPNQPVMTYATGMIGFRKSGRGTYDAGFQLASYFLKQIQERGLLRDIKEIEVVFRGFGSGREAVTKVILGQEGRLIRPKIIAVTDSTRLKFGGSRSPNPRRL
ncbi:translational machinery component [Myriangium duriaei CBS 260.36]|uniref:Translational machinery component n=1 Tax=Myriangium duriaei CBS 260.36 TaxID=1168546 RepID=A0A9P4J0V1_9PEZI|nr:translational machinery component [Myriangium duriaei CBS 260.36]